MGSVARRGSESTQPSRNIWIRRSSEEPAFVFSPTRTTLWQTATASQQQQKKTSSRPLSVGEPLEEDTVAQVTGGTTQPHPAPRSKTANLLTEIKFPIALSQPNLLCCVMNMGEVDMRQECVSYLPSGKVMLFQRNWHAITSVQWLCQGLRDRLGDLPVANSNASGSGTRFPKNGSRGSHRRNRDPDVEKDDIADTCAYERDNKRTRLVSHFFLFIYYLTRLQSQKSKLWGFLAVRVLALSRPEVSASSYKQRTKR